MFSPIEDSSSSVFKSSLSSLIFGLNAVNLFNKFSSINGSLEFIFLNSQFSREFIQLLIIIAGQFGSLSEVFVQFLKSNFIVHAFALEHLDLLEDSISLLG